VRSDTTLEQLAREINPVVRGWINYFGRFHPSALLFSLNRINVATSRAKCACVLVASPSLFEVDCRSPAQMKLVSALHRYLELARAL